MRGSLNLTWAETQKLTFWEKPQLSWSPAAQDGSDLPEVTQEAAVAYRPHSHTSALQNFKIFNLILNKMFICLPWILVVARKLSCGMWALVPGSNPGPLHWERRVSVTGPQGKSPLQHFMNLFMKTQEKCGPITSPCHRDAVTIPILTPTPGFYSPPCAENPAMTSLEAGRTIRNVAIMDLNRGWGG